MGQTIFCEKHGAEEFAIACIHICRAIDSREKVGFYECTDTDCPRPDAWCAACEQWNRDNPDKPVEEWMKVADFRLLCIRCWDEAKEGQCG